MGRVNQKKTKIISDIESMFVDSYDTMSKVKSNIDDVLYMIGIDKFSSYNSFCSILKQCAELYVKNHSTDNVDDVLSMSINMAVRKKITSDSNYADKISMYFNDAKMVNIVEKDAKNS